MVAGSFIDHRNRYWHHGRGTAYLGDVYENLRAQREGANAGFTGGAGAVSRRGFADIRLLYAPVPRGNNELSKTCIASSSELKIRAPVLLERRVEAFVWVSGRLLAVLRGQLEICSSTDLHNGEYSGTRDPPVWA